MKRYDRAMVWFRRGPRHAGHAALSHALAESRSVYCVFVFDVEILEELERRDDRRVEFIWHSVQELKSRLQQLGGETLVPERYAI